MKISEVMTTDVATATVDTTLEDIANLMRAENVGAIPILDDDDDLAGIVTDRDIVIRCIAEGKDATEATAEDILSYRLDSVSPDHDVRAAARIMAERQIRRLPVVENGKLVGIVSIGDLAVKTNNEDLIGGTLEDVSQGVKQSSRGAREGADPEAQRVSEDDEANNERIGRQPTRQESERNISRNVSPKLQGNQRDVRSAGSRARGTASIRPAEINANQQENGGNTRDDARSKSWQNREAEEYGHHDEFTEELKKDNAGEHRANRRPVTPSLQLDNERKSRNQSRRTGASGNRKQSQAIASDRDSGRNEQGQNLGRYAQSPGNDLNNDAGNVPSNDAEEIRAGGQRGASRAGRNNYGPRGKDQKQYGRHMASEQTTHDLGRRSSGEERPGSRAVQSREAQPQGLKSDDNPRKQGITNRKASTENRRNDKVVPFREDNRVRNTAVKKPTVSAASPKRSGSRKRA